MPHSQNHHAPALSLGTAFKLLAVPVRRQVCYYLRESKQHVASLDELVEHVNSETEAPDSREQIRVGLVHTHLPKLANHGVIEYDSRSEMVRYRDGSYLESVVEFAAEQELQH
jgi:hypothetical protein